MRLWDAATGEPRITFTGHTDAIRGLVFTPDGQTVLSGGFDRTIQAWDPATGVVRYVLRGHSDGVHDLALSPDGRTLASASYDKTCILWDLPGRRPRVTLRGHTGRLNSVAFSPDGRTVATSSDDHTVRLWDAADGSPRGILEGHIDEVDGLAFSPDGRLASSAADKTIRLWDPASGQTLLVLKGHAGRIRCIKFSPDGRTLASASYDRTMKLWEAAPAAALAAAGSEAAPNSDTEAADARPRSTREELRPTLYATSSNLAMAAWEANDIRRLRFLLDLMKPREDEPDLRGWEWHYLNRLAHAGSSRRSAVMIARSARSRSAPTAGPSPRCTGVVVSGSGIQPPGESGSRSSHSGGTNDVIAVGCVRPGVQPRRRTPRGPRTRRKPRNLEHPHRSSCSSISR